MAIGVGDSQLLNKGFEQLTSAGAVLTPTVPSGATKAMIVSETKAVRLRDDGTNPTGSVGFLVPVGTIVWYTGQLTKLRIIEDGATSTAKVNILYYT